MTACHPTNTEVILTSPSRVKTLDGMSRALVAAPNRPQPRPSDVIGRTIKAFIAGWGLTREDFVSATNITLRTFDRRLSGESRQGWTANEVETIAAFMTKVSGRPVAVADLYAGWLDLGGVSTPPDAPQPQQKIRTRLSSTLDRSVSHLTRAAA